MVNNTLSGTEYYEKLTQNPEQHDRQVYNKFLKKYKDCLKDKEFDYLNKFESKQSNFYGLPKVHKSESIGNACRSINDEYVRIENVNDLKVRPIVAGPSCQTHRLSNLIDIILRPLTKHVKSYVRDTTDFLNSLPEHTDKDTTLVSFDVESLYSNIPHALGIEAIEFNLQLFFLARSSSSLH